MSRSPADEKVRVLSVLATAILVAAVLGLYLSRSLFSWSVAILVLQGVAALLMLWARLTFGMRSFHAAANPTAGALITTGPYRYVRHPIYTAIWIFVWAGIAAHLSTLSVALGVVVALALGLRAGCEEYFLHAHFPDYAEYAKRTARMIPYLF